jgi:hypothetical protein
MRTLTANQVVAWNVRLARRGRGWTQEQAAAQLERFLGVRWSKATFSSMERSPYTRDRIRQFTADEVVAFSLAFGLPVPFFFIPPAHLDGERVVIVPGEGSRVSLPPAELVQTTFGGHADVRERLQALFRDVGIEELSQEQRLIDSLFRHGMADALARNVGDLEEWATQLRRIADALMQAKEKEEDLLHEESAQAAAYEDWKSR